MKKKIPFKHPFKVRKWQIFLGILCGIGIIVSIVVGLNTINEKKEVSAHPTNTIKLDEGGANEFEVPMDGSEHLEYSTSYNNYRQNNVYTPILTKQISETESARTTLFSSQISNSIIRSYITEHGNIISMMQISTSPYTGYLNVNQTKIILQSRDGTWLAERWLHTTPNDVDKASGNKATYYNNFFQKDGSTFLAVYAKGDSPVNTTTIVDTGNSLDVSAVDNDQGLNISTINLRNQYLQTQWIGPDNIPISSTCIYSNANEKNYYVTLKHENGIVLDEYSFETSSELATDITTYPNHYSQIRDVYYLDDTRIIGHERLSTTNGLFDCISLWELDTTTKVAARTELYRMYNSDVQIEKDISTNNEVYFQHQVNSRTTEARVDILKVDLNTLSVDVVKNFPRHTRLRFINRGDGDYFYAGQISTFEDDFQVLDGVEGMYSGLMDDEFNIKNSSYIRTQFTSQITPTNIMTFSGTEDLFVLSGSFRTEETHFIDEVRFGNYPGEQVGNGKTWVPQTYSPGKGNGFVSILANNEDWAPLIKSPTPFKVNITDSDIKNGNQIITDRWLLTGSKTGSLTDADATKVYDTMDIDDGLNTFSQSWLNNRINKNPKTLVYETGTENIESSDPIDWEKLGFNKNKTGPQIVSYFVTDSQNQVSTTSGLVNNVTPQTIEEDDYALDAQNFHIPLTGIDTAILDATRFKELAKTMAWNMDDGTIDEDGTDSNKLSARVTVDEGQLDDLRNATVAKPYPVDVTYEPEAGVTIRNRVWVFVTTKNTLPNNESIYPEVTPDETNGIVYYADDYSIPYRLRGNHNADDVLEMGNVKVYDYYDTNHETSNELSVLADRENIANLDVLWGSLFDVWNAPRPGVIEFGYPRDHRPLVQYTWDGTVSGYHQAGTTQGGLYITLTSDVLLHVRQVVLDESTQLVVPTEGYLNVRTNLNDGMIVEDSDELRAVKIPSEKNQDLPTFETFAVSTEHMTNPAGVDEIELDLILPEFYEPVGSVITVPAVVGGGAADGSDHQNKGEHEIFDVPLSFNKNRMDREGEYFITIYLKPKLPEKGPQPYSWDYKVNDFGLIKTE